MPSAMLAEFLAFNDLVAGLVRSGVNVPLGLPRHGAVEACEQIGAIVVRRVGEGASVQEALHDRAVPEAYRSVAQLAMVTGDPEAALGAACRDAQVQDNVSRTVRTSLRYPLVICILAYVGMLLFCVLLAPRLRATYESMEVSAGWGMEAVNWLCTSLPYWVVAAPLLLLVVLGCSRWSRARAGAAGGSAEASMRGGSQIAINQRLARFANMLAAYLDAGVAMPDALRAAAAVWDDGALKNAALETAASLRSGEATGDDNPLGSRLPPLLRWAIWRAEPVDRPRALQMAAGVYREAAKRRRRRAAIAEPMLACVVIGGGVTLLYALALFLPVTQLLQGLAR
jgi:type II secretory pathway component PulF